MSTTNPPLDLLQSALNERFTDAPNVSTLNGADEVAYSALARMAGRGAHRHFKGEHIDPVLIETLCAVALSAPSKSDLQQRDIVIVSDPVLRADLNRLINSEGWAADAPSMLVFCGNNRRQRLIHSWRERSFANDHLDAFFNAAIDSGIALSAFVTAAEAVGLGCCPISAVRNEAEAVSRLLGLPDYVFPVAGLAVGWPADKAPISHRLPLRVTVHKDRYEETGLHGHVERYDRERAKRQPYARQRFAEENGGTIDPSTYGWSEDKARQYAKPERADFGEFVRRRGFDLR